MAAEVGEEKEIRKKNMFKSILHFVKNFYLRVEKRPLLYGNDTCLGRRFRGPVKNTA